MDAVTTVTMASEVANSQVVWSILCIGLTAFVLWSQRKDKIATEERHHKEKSETLLVMKELGDGLTSQANTMKEISSSLKNLEGRMEQVERITDRNTRGGN